MTRPRTCTPDDTYAVADALWLAGFMDLQDPGSGEGVSTWEWPDSRIPGPDVRAAVCSNDVPSSVCSERRKEAPTSRFGAKEGTSTCRWRCC